MIASFLFMALHTKCARMTAPPIPNIRNVKLNINQYILSPLLTSVCVAQNAIYDTQNSLWLIERTQTHFISSTNHL